MDKFDSRVYVTDTTSTCAQAKRLLRETGLAIILAEGNKIPSGMSAARAMLAEGWAEKYHLRILERANGDRAEISLVTERPGTEFPDRSRYWHPFDPGSELIANNIRAP